MVSQARDARIDTIWMNSWHVGTEQGVLRICQELRNLISEIRMLKVLLLLVLRVTNWVQASLIPN
jgi:hypothetical protein